MQVSIQLSMNEAGYDSQNPSEKPAQANNRAAKAPRTSGNRIRFIFFQRIVMDLQFFNGITNNSY